MGWQLVQTVEMKKGWDFTPVIPGRMFRLIHDIPPTSPTFRGLIAQCYDFGARSFNDVSLYQIQKIYSKTQKDIIQFADPLGLDNRQLTFKRIDKYLNPWMISIEVLTESKPTTAPQFQGEMLTVNFSDQRQFYLINIPNQPQLTELFINGVKATYNLEYSFEGTTLSWTSPLVLEPTDEVEILY